MPVYASHLIVVLVSFIAVLITTPLAKKLAFRLDAVDRPSARRINTRTIPRMGGVALFVGIIVGVGLQYMGTHYLGWPAVFIPSPMLTINYWGLAAAFLCIFLVGFIDDMHPLRPRIKLAGQVLAACIAVASGVVIGDIVNPFHGYSLVHLGILAYPLTVLYLVAYVNIINLIDGLDGLAAGISALASCTLCILAFWSGRLDAAILSSIVCASCISFLFFNFHPASIFMGDCGSLLLGFALGVASLLSVTRFAGLTTVIVPLVVASVPIIDTFFAIVRRLRAHVSIGHPDKGHIHHRLLSEGFDQRQAVVLMYLWTGLMCAGSLIMTQVAALYRIAIFVILLGVSALFTYQLRLFDPVLLHHTPDEEEADADSSNSSDQDTTQSC